MSEIIELTFDHNDADYIVLFLNDYSGYEKLARDISNEIKQSTNKRDTVVSCICIRHNSSYIFRFVVYSQDNFNTWKISQVHKYIEVILEGINTFQEITNEYPGVSDSLESELSKSVQRQDNNIRVIYQRF